jgi:prepilin-type N-terminal cleavage/methylation domain-containing protein
MINRKGFTIIEFLIVLAIVGLILAIVLFAVPNLMRSGRNTRRNQDSSLLLTLVNDQKQATPNGALPASCDTTQPACFLRQSDLAYYDNASSTVPVIHYFHNDVPFNAGMPQLSATDQHAPESVYIHSYAICNGDTPTGLYASPSSFVVQYAIETFSGPRLMCKGL